MSMDEQKDKCIRNLDDNMESCDDIFKVKNVTGE